MKKDKDKDFTCSFCGREANSQNPIVVLNEKFQICKMCVDLIQDSFQINQAEQEFIKSKNNKKDSLVDFKDLSPKKIKDKLDDFIVGQDVAKKILAVTVYNHYKRIKNNYENKKDNDSIEIEKSNVLLVGPTGSGKTLIAKTLAKILDVPFAIADATTLTEAGYVGEDVENVLLKLIQNANYDIKKAERGIIYIDEIDKIARKSENKSITRDVSGEGVQQALLKIIESTKARVPANGGRKHPMGQTIEIDTTNILFILGGAFVGIDKVILERKQETSIGFSGFIKENSDDIKYSEIIKDLTPDDLVKFGLIPELIGRIPVTAGLDELSEETLVSILTKPKNAIVKQYQKLFKYDNIKLEFEKDALLYIAKKSKDLKTGARSLRTIIEKVMLDVMYDVPNDKEIKEVKITKESIDSPNKVVITK